MFSRHYRLYSRILTTADTVVALPVLYLAYAVRAYGIRLAPTELGRFFFPELLPFADYLYFFLVFMPVWFLLLAGTQRYRDLLYRSASTQLVRILNFSILAGSLMGFATFALKLEVSRPIFFTFWILVPVALGLNRAILYGVLRSRNINEHNQVKILIAGTDPEAREVGRILQKSKKWGYHVSGYVTLGENEAIDSDVPVVASISQLPEVLQDQSLADEIIFSGTDRKDLEQYEDVINLCEELGIRVRVAADLIPVKSRKVSIEFLDTLPLITFHTVPEHNLERVVKRVLDFSVASLSMVLLFPLMVITALAVKLTSPGPIFYRQTRCGLYGRTFKLTKFRTMIDGAEDQLWEIRHLNEMDGPVFKMRNDPRVTPFGNFLRKSSIDELPQLWNVIKGEMSIVGPRAPLPEEVRHYSVCQRRRLSVKPGITCLWQVSGRNNISFERWMAMDLEYIDNWSVWLDLVIMLKTIPAVFTGRGAH